MFENSLEFAQKLDQNNSLKDFRGEFLIPQHNGKSAIYFLGNSLGLQPKRTSNYIQEVLDQWSNHGVEGFFSGRQPWMEYHQQLTKTLSLIVGALPDEVVVMNQLTVNLHLMLASFYRPQGGRRKILCEAKAFPSDQYMLHSHIQHRGLNPDEIIIEVAPREGETLIREEDILSAIEQNKNEIVLVFFGGVNYYTGQVFNMEKISEDAHKIGATIGLDLAHATGNLSLRLHDWNIDFACWCSYKYLNSGPGAIGGCFIHKNYHNDASLNRFAGWWGNKKKTQFLMRKKFDPELSAEGWQLSTPSPVLYAMHKASLRIFEEAGIETVFRANQLLNDYLWFVLEEVIKQAPSNALYIITPKQRNERGCQVSMIVKNGKKVFDYLSDNGVYSDWREPDVIRIAPVALYNSYEEVWRFAQILKSAINLYCQ